MGAVIPPMILFNGKRYRKTFNRGNPSGSQVMMTPKRSMTSEVFVKWLEHFAKFKPSGQTLLVMDGIVNKAEEYAMSLVCLPSNTTHELKPLDKLVFRSFEHHWDTELLYWWDGDPKYPGRKLTKDTFSEVFTPVWSKSMTLSNLTNGFCVTGIHSFDPKVLKLVALHPKSRNEKAKLPYQEISLTSHKKAKKAPGVLRKKAVNYKAQNLTRKLCAGVHDNDACSNQLENIIAPIDQPLISKYLLLHQQHLLQIHKLLLQLYKLQHQLPQHKVGLVLLAEGTTRLICGLAEYVLFGYMKNVPDFKNTIRKITFALAGGRREDTPVPFILAQVPLDLAIVIIAHLPSHLLQDFPGKFVPRSNARQVDVQHVYSEVTFAIGSQIIRLALDDPEPMVDLQGNK
ncbi:hypothetical protein PR048_001181 [Dryococelus australis]|uniref:DDE-1 domain-containing protein n=1 Tax=Dryococelus australis TaxID=614101 RepID=A0ABQ9IGQ9_9NEOP|nr:hypothetical protein PR048_001181 [Dryococelus australis]